MIREDDVVTLYDAEKLSENDLVYINNRSNPLKVVKRRGNFKEASGGPRFHLFLEGNGTEYILTIHENSMRLYTESEIKSVEDVGWTDGIRVMTKSKSGERVREGRFVYEGICNSCERREFFDDESESYYCVVCGE